MLPAECLAITTPLVYSEWGQALQSHPDCTFASYITQGIRQGFRIGYQHGKHACKSTRTNMPSARTNPGPVQQYLAAELAAHRVVILPANSSVSVHTSPFGVIPKSNQPGAWRLILDLSHPSGFSVNDGIPRELCTLKYPTVDDAIGKILAFERGALLAKVDVKHAFRNVPVHPDDRGLLGMAWEDQTLIDTVLPFGLRSAPWIFSALADALEWIATQAGVSTLLHYLDDFLTIGAPGSQECQENLNIIRRTCERLGVPLKVQKIEGPSATLTFLGILLDTVNSEIRLPAEKLAQLQELIQLWRTRRRCKKRALLSLIGKLAHACKVITPGRIFLRRMIDTACTAKHLHHWIALKAEFRSDIEWWVAFLPRWNGRSMMDVHTTTWQHTVSFTSDAAGKWGCGAVWQDQWLQCPWGECWQEVNIAAKELLPIVLACAVWGPCWQHKKVQVHCDNWAVVQVLNHLTSKDSMMLHLLRCLFFFCAHYDIQLRAQHLSGVHNSVADAVSRNHLQVFRELHPLAAPRPTPIPPALWEMLVVRRPDWLSAAWRELLQSSLSAALPLAHAGHTTLPKPST